MRRLLVRIWVSAATHPSELQRKGYSELLQGSGDHRPSLGYGIFLQSLSATAWLFWGLPTWSFLLVSLRLTLLTLFELG